MPCNIRDIDYITVGSCPVISSERYLLTQSVIRIAESKHSPKGKMMENLFRVKALIFDLDGTIVDSKEAYYEAARVTMQALGKDMFDVTTAIEIPKRLEQNRPIDDMIKGIKVHVFKKIYLEAYYQATLKRTVPFPRTDCTLEQLSSRFALAVTTRRNVPRAEVQKELAKFGFEKYFSIVVTSRETLNPKPSPEALLKCADFMKVSIHDCAVIGDSVTDVLAGKNAGAHTVAVLTGIFTEEELREANPDAILKSINDLPRFLC